VPVDQLAVDRAGTLNAACCSCCTTTLSKRALFGCAPSGSVAGSGFRSIPANAVAMALYRASLPCTGSARLQIESPSICRSGRSASGSSAPVLKFRISALSVIFCAQPVSRSSTSSRFESRSAMSSGSENFANDQSNHSISPVHTSIPVLRQLCADSYRAQTCWSGPLVFFEYGLRSESQFAYGMPGSGFVPFRIYRITGLFGTAKDRV
jgi:hypothetical protein